MATRRTRKRQFCSPLSRVTLLMLVWSTLLYASQEFAYKSLALTLPSELLFAFHCAYFVLWLLLPVTGWVADAWLGRYRSITIGLLLSLITVLASQTSFIMLQINWTPIPAFVLLCITMLLASVSFGTFYTSLLPFTLDQMIGASAEELSAVVHWYCWGFFVGLLTQ